MSLHALRHSTAPNRRLAALYLSAAVGWRPDPGKIRNSSLYKRFCSVAAGALLSVAAVCPATAQIVSGLQPHNNISVYATFPTDVTPDFRYYAPVLFGYSIGGYLQTPYFVGLEVRGQIQRRENVQHQESALIGPRVAVRYGRFVPYGAFLIGAGNGWRFRHPPVAGQKFTKPVEDRGTQWTLAGGVDFKVSRRFSVRLGEVSYSHLSLKEWDLTPVNITAGVVFRLN